MLDSETEEKIPVLLLAADFLERSAEALPPWSGNGEEPWYLFLERRYEAEVAIMEQLRQAPQCQLKTCPARMHLELTLAGISVRTDQGLEAALRKWARRARAQVSW